MGTLSQSGSQYGKMALASSIGHGLKYRKYQLVPLENASRIGSRLVTKCEFLSVLEIIYFSLPQQVLWGWVLSIQAFCELIFCMSYSIALVHNLRRVCDGCLCLYYKNLYTYIHCWPNIELLDVRAMAGDSGLEMNHGGAQS